jgi:hypothetical protein
MRRIVALIILLQIITMQAIGQKKTITYLALGDLIR